MLCLGGIDFELLFRTDKKIGKGQFSEVYKAYDKLAGCYVALKKVKVSRHLLVQTQFMRPNLVYFSMKQVLL